MAKYKMVPLGENVEEMFIGPFGSSLKNENFVDFNEAYCMVYEQKHAIKKTMNLPTRYINKEKYDELKRFNIQGGDIIVSCRGTIGETYIIPDDAPLGIMHPSIMKIRLKEGIYDKYYFNLLLNSRLNKHKVEANGSGIKMAISATELGKELFPVPTMDEQLKIADIIFKISDIVKKRIKELDTLDELVKARFVEMFGDPVKNPKGWEVVTIGDIVTEVRYGTSKPAVEGGKYPYLRMNNLTADGHLDLNDLKYIDIPDDEIEKCVVRKGDVLFNRTNSIELVGKTVVFDLQEDMIIAGYIIRVRLNKRLLPEILSQYMNLEALKDILRSMAKGAVNQANINAQELQSIKVYIPDMELQKQFIEMKNQVDKSKVAVQKALDETQMLFDSLMQKYFA